MQLSFRRVLIQGTLAGLAAVLVGLSLPGTAQAAGFYTFQGNTLSPSPATNVQPQPTPPDSATNVPVLNAVNGGDALGTVSASPAASSETDTYEFYITQADLGSGNMLKLVLTGSQNNTPNLSLNWWESTGQYWQFTSGGNGNDGVDTLYFSLSATAGSGGLPQYFYVNVNANTTSSYTLQLSVVPSAVISGTVNPVGVGASGSDDFDVWAQDANADQYSGTGTDSNGDYSVFVPLGVTITSMYAERYYNYYSNDSGSAGPVPPDWSYGPTKYDDNATFYEYFSSAVTLSGIDFNAYPEAVLKGTYSGTAKAPSSNNGNAWSVELSSEYNPNNDSNSPNADTTTASAGSSGSYEFHNVEPGTWHLEVSPQDGSSAYLVYDNVVATDGLANSSYDFAFNQGVTLTVNVSPAATAAEEVSVSFHSSGAGFNNNNNNASFTGAGTTLYGLPANQTYDITVQPSGDGSGGQYFGDMGVAIGGAGSYSTNVSGINPTATISGTVTDAAGVGLSVLGVYAFPHGYSPASNNQCPAVSAAVNSSTGTYTLSVDPSYRWDLAVLNKNDGNNGIPPIYGVLADIASGTTTANLTTANGVTVSGSIEVNGAAPSFEQDGDFGNNGNDFVSAWSSSAGNWTDGGAVADAAYAITHTQAGSYNFNYAPYFMTGVTHTATVSTADLSENFDLVPNPSADVYKPWAKHLVPPDFSGGTISTVSSTLPAVSLELYDGSLGTGIAAVAASNVGFDGGTGNVAGFSYTASTGALSFSPSAPLSQGVTHTVTVNFKDQAATPNSNSVTWSFYVAAASTPTDTVTVTPSPTTTATRTATPSPSATSTISPAYSATNSPTQSPSFTASPSFTQSLTWTNSPTATATPSDTVTSTATPTATQSYTASPSYTVTETSTDSPTFTASPTRTPSFTVTPTPAFAVSTLGKASWGPVPAAAGQPVVLYFSQAPASGSCVVYDIAGKRVADFSFGQSASLQTGGLAAGVYFVRTVVDYRSGATQTLFQKIVIVR